MLLGTPLFGGTDLFIYLLLFLDVILALAVSVNLYSVASAVQSTFHALSHLIFAADS